MVIARGGSSWVCKSPISSKASLLRYGTGELERKNGEVSGSRLSCLRERPLGSRIVFARDVDNLSTVAFAISEGLLLWLLTRPNSISRRATSSSKCEMVLRGFSVPWMESKPKHVAPAVEHGPQLGY